jgi:hypothetical protein
MTSQLGKDWQGERRRLPRARLGTADHIATFDNQRDGPELNGRGINVTHRFDTFEDGRRQT